MFAKFIIGSTAAAELSMSLEVIILTEAGASCTFCLLLEAENTISSSEVASSSRLTITS